MSYTPRLKQKYNEEIKAKLKEQFGYSSPMAIPSLKKIAINQGIGEGITDKKLVDKGIDELTLITGQ
jgi:large subunit ribosomal protein L5